MIWRLLKIVESARYINCVIGIVNAFIPSMPPAMPPELRKRVAHPPTQVLRSKRNSVTGRVGGCPTRFLTAIVVIAVSCNMIEGCLGGEDFTPEMAVIADTSAPPQPESGKPFTCPKCRKERERILKLIYIAGPYSSGDKLRNVNRAIDIGAEIMKRGHMVIIPHLSHYIDERHSFPYVVWLKMDLVLLDKCDAIFRMQGKSHGADGEVAYASAKSIPIFDDLDKLFSYFST